jgi:hypothetical protein
MTNTITKTKLNRQLKEQGLHPIKAQKSGRVKGLKISFGDYEIWEREELLIIKVKGTFAHKVEKAQAIANDYKNVVVKAI